MYIFHISDIHFSADDLPGQKNLERIIDSINHQHVRPDMVVITGDLIWKQHNEYYAPCFAALQKLPAPYLVITGNHDTSARLIDALAAFAPHHPRPQLENFLQYEYDDASFPVRFLALDTCKTGCGGGNLDTRRLQWLEARLSDSAADKPAVILLHQYTLPTGSGFFDSHAAGWYRDFNDLVSRYRQNIALILCGHLHNSLHSEINGIPLISGFSTNWSEELLNQANKDPGRDRLRPLAYLIHRIDDSRQLTTYTVTVR